VLRTGKTREKRQVSSPLMAGLALMGVRGLRVGSPVVTETGCARRSHPGIFGTTICMACLHQPGCMSRKASDLRFP
jgi:hypothetical protein